MRESIGATQIFAICMVLIVLFTGYLAISVNYAKAFRIKSSIVSQIEQNHGYNTTVTTPDGRVQSLEEKIKTYLTAQGYTAYGTCPNTIDADGYTSEWQKVGHINDSAPSGKDNVCIYRLTLPVQGNGGYSTMLDDICTQKYYYKVITFFKFDIPIINTFLTFKVSGDTGYVITKDNSCAYG